MASESSTPTKEAKHTPGPWIVNGLTQANLWRIDGCGEGAKVGIEMLMNPVALVKEHADAELIANLPALLESHKQLQISLWNCLAGRPDWDEVRKVLLRAKEITG